jgi:hypothetical protein
MLHVRLGHLRATLLTHAYSTEKAAFSAHIDAMNVHEIGIMSISTVETSSRSWRWYLLSLFVLVSTKVIDVTPPFTFHVSARTIATSNGDAHEIEILNAYGT